MDTKEVDTIHSAWLLISTPRKENFTVAKSWLSQRKLYFYFLHYEVKGIVSRDFGTLLPISLDRFEGRNRAG
jgi:hypothetical protein